MVQNSLSVADLDNIMSSNVIKAESSNSFYRDTSLTPTTLKSITQIFESDDCLKKLHRFEDDGFVVPLPVSNPETLKAPRRTSFVVSSSDRKSSWQGGTTTVVLGSTIETKDEPIEEPEEIKETTSTSVTRSSTRLQSQKRVQVEEVKPPVKTRGKRTWTRISEESLSPEESERVRIRRERNKAAAARCRKRRLDTISGLESEVAQLEAKKRSFEDTIIQLKSERMQFEYILSEHRNSPDCKLASPPSEVKDEPMAPPFVEKCNRPASLDIGLSRSSVEGVAIETPTNVISILGFDVALLTAPTPASPVVGFTCSTQQLSTADNCLNTPSSDTVSLLSL